MLHGPPLPLAHAYQPPGASPAAATPAGRRGLPAAATPAGDAARDRRRLTAAAATRFQAVAAAWHAVLAGRRMLAMKGPRLAMIAAR